MKVYFLGNRSGENQCGAGSQIAASKAQAVHYLPSLVMATVHFKVKAVYEYKSPHDDDLDFPNGQIITVKEEEGDDWYVGEYTDSSGVKKEGLFPKNFVERYEPDPPPRPMRAPKSKATAEESQSSPPPLVEEDTDQLPDGSKHGVDEPLAKRTEADSSAPLSIIPPLADALKSADQQKVPQTVQAGAPVPVAKKAPPPAVAEKPSSFKDRIAAFNKPAAPPVAPFKPAAPPTGFIKKPFVAPPPARDAYVPPPRERPPPKVYRREEDPEISNKDQEGTKRQTHDNDVTERADQPAASREQPEDEEAPKPTSLKERIALLQKQQMEQAARRSEVASKDKPKRPPKKRTESEEGEGRRDVEVVEPVAHRKTDHHDNLEAEMSSDSIPPLSATRPVRIPPTPDLKQQDRELFSDGNDADQSAAGETTEDAEVTPISVEEEEEKSRRIAPHPPSRTSTGVGQDAQAVDEAGSAEEEPEEEVEAETRRRIELRERMAKMSGGMGMPGMFGPPGGMPVPGGAPRKKKPTGASEHKAVAEDEDGSVASPPPPPHRTPLIPIPGMQSVKRRDSEDTGQSVRKEQEPESSISGNREPEETADTEEFPDRPEQRHLADADIGTPPPVAEGNCSILISSSSLYRSQMSPYPIRRKTCPTLIRSPIRPNRVLRPTLVIRILSRLLEQALAIENKYTLYCRTVPLT